MDDQLIDLIRREAVNVAGMRHWTGTVVVTSYDAKKHAIKGVLVPHEIETAWIPIGASAIGSGAGDVMGPKCGSADKLDGDQFSVQFDAGNTNTLIATHRIFSDDDVPPLADSGEMLRQHASGTKLFLDKDGQLIASRTDGSMLMLTSTGDAVVMPKDGGTLYHGGDPTKGGTFDFVMTASGPSPNVKAKIG